MTVWGSHTKSMDHLLRRASEHIGKSRTSKSSIASKMDKMSAAEERKALYEQRQRSKFPNRPKSNRG